MNRTWIVMVAWLAFLVPAQAQPVRFSAALDDVLQAAASEQEIAIIVRFKGRPVPDQFVDASPQVRRQKIISALRQHAMQSEAPLRAFLKGQQAYALKSLWLINGASLRLPARLVRQLSGMSGVESIALDGTLMAPQPSPGTSEPAAWNLELIRATDLWRQGYLGDGVVVATLDTGADAAHPDIGPKWRGGTNSWFDPYGEHATPNDIHGHGTQVLGLIVGGDAGGSAIGVAPAAKWIAAKIFDNTGTATYSAIHQAYQWVLDPDGDPALDDTPQIVNNSWGLPRTAGVCDTEFQSDIDTLRAAGIAVFFSAGNAGPATGSSLSPANYAQSFSVGALDGQQAVANFSSRGPSACDGAIFPSVVAPGVNVHTSDLTYNGLFPDAYIDVSGTSFAVAHVAGGAALLMSAAPQATASQVESALRSSAVDISAIGSDNDAGQGMLDLVDAQQSLSQASTPQSGLLQFSNDNYTVAEDGAQVALVVNRIGGSSGVVNVAYSTADGTANAGLDYIATAGTLTFADGEVSKNLLIPILGDSLAEGDETVIVRLDYPAGGAQLGWPYTAVVTIADQATGGVMAVADSYTMTEDGTLTVGAPGVLGNDTGTGLGSILFETVSSGSLALAADGSFIYTPLANFHGLAQFSYRVTDGTNTSAPATVSITVSPVNDAPVTMADAYTVTAGKTLIVRAPGVLANDHDPDSVVFRVRTRSVTPPANGTLSIKGSGRFIYTPAAGFTGVDRFTYRIRDDMGANSNRSVVTITVQPASSP